MSTIYLSGPVSLGGTSNPDAIARNVARFKAVAATLRAAGNVVLDPTDIDGDDSWTWAQWMRPALAMLIQADRVGTLPGWEQSRGALLEVFVARNLGLPITDMTRFVETLDGAA